MVNRAISHFKVPFIIDFVMEVIPTLQNSMFMMSDPRNFAFVGTILEEMLLKVPSDNMIVNEYRKIPSSGVHPIMDEL